jgi:hypothetical protein
MQRTLLAASALVIVLGGGLLLLDALFDRTPPAMTHTTEGNASTADEALAEVASSLGLQLNIASPDADMLQKALASFPELGVADARVEAVMSRADAQHRLWLFEFEVDETLLIAPASGAGHHSHRGTLTRLGIAIQQKHARYPRWIQDEHAEMLAPWNAGARERLARIEDLRLAMQGEFVIAIARPRGFGLLEQMQRERSVEFHPGLRNSALGIDVQRVLDVVNLLDPGATPLPSIHHVEVDVDLSRVRKPQIAARLDAIRAQQERDLAALRQTLAAQRDGGRARADSDAASEKQAAETPLNPASDAEECKDSSPEFDCGNPIQSDSPAELRSSST